MKIKIINNNFFMNTETQVKKKESVQCAYVIKCSFAFIKLSNIHKY